MKLEKQTEVTQLLEQHGMKLGGGGMYAGAGAVCRFPPSRTFISEAVKLHSCPCEGPGSSCFYFDGRHFVSIYACPLGQ